MTGGFIAFRCSNFDTTAEREQFRFVCNVLKDKYRGKDELCLLIGNYNLLDIEFDAILVKQDVLCAIEFKNYGGKIVARDNGDWTADGVIIKGGSRKTVYQQARINHAALKNGLASVGIPQNWIRDVPTLIVFNQPCTMIDNRLTGKTQSWLHITDNRHFREKVEDLTSRYTSLSNLDLVNLAIKLNLRDFVDRDLSCYHKIRHNQQQASGVSVELGNRRTPEFVTELLPNQVFVFGTDRMGSQKYGAAGLAAKRFGAQIGVIDGPTGRCYALPTKGFTEQELARAVANFEQYVRANLHLTFLVTAVGCGHAGFSVERVAGFFKGLIKFPNVFFPESFLQVYQREFPHYFQTESLATRVVAAATDPHTDIILGSFPTCVHRVLRYLLAQGIPFNKEGGFTLLDSHGKVIAEAELGIESEKIVFYPFNIQSEMVFKNFGYLVMTEDEYLESKTVNR